MHRIPYNNEHFLQSISESVARNTGRSQIPSRNWLETQRQIRCVGPERIALQANGVGRAHSRAAGSAYSEGELIMVAVNYDWDELEDNIDEEYDDAGVTVAEYTTEPARFGNVIGQRRRSQTIT